MKDRSHAHTGARRRGTTPFVLAVVAALSIAAAGDARARSQEPLAELLELLPGTPRAGIVVLAEGAGRRDPEPS